MESLESGSRGGVRHEFVRRRSTLTELDVRRCRINRADFILYVFHFSLDQARNVFRVPCHQVVHVLTLFGTDREY